MSNAFDDREKGYEAKFKLDQELYFKMRARRNKLLGLWLAEQFGLDAEKTEAYSKEVVVADLDEPSIEDMVSKVMTDIRARGLSISEEQVRDQIITLDSVALSELKEKDQN